MKLNFILYLHTITNVDKSNVFFNAKDDTCNNASLQWAFEGRQISCVYIRTQRLWLHRCVHMTQLLSNFHKNLHLSETCHSGLEIIQLIFFQLKFSYTFYQLSLFFAKDTVFLGHAADCKNGVVGLIWVDSRIVGNPPAAFHVVSPDPPDPPDPLTGGKSYPQPPLSMMAPLHRLLGPSFPPQIAVRGLSSLHQLRQGLSVSDPSSRAGYSIEVRRSCSRSKMPPLRPAAHFDYLVSWASAVPRPVPPSVLPCNFTGMD